MSVKLSDSQKEIIDHLLKDLITLFKNSKIELGEWEGHSIREMVWREIFFSEKLGNNDHSNTDILWGEYFQKSLPEKELQKYWNLEKLLLNVSKKQSNIYTEADAINKKISEMVAEREKIIEEGNKNYTEASEHQPKQKSLEEEEKKLEEEWESFELKNSAELDKEKLENLIERQNQLNNQREEFVQLFSKFLKKESEIKEEISNYSKQIERYHANWAKLNKEWTELSRQISDIQETIIAYQNHKLLEIAKKMSD